MKVLILGATGLFGSALTTRMIKNGNYELTLFSRHSSDKYMRSDKVTVINGDATSEDNLRKAVSSQDVVYCAVSGSELPEVAANLVKVMTEEKVQRLLFMGAVGIYNEIPDEIDGEDNLDNEPAQIPNRKAVDIIEASNLNYTILRPGYLRDGSEDDYTLTFKGEQAKGYISTIPSVVNLAISLINDKNLYSCESVSITKDARTVAD